jgi:NIPSNAP protein
VLYEMRTYTLRPGRLPAYVADFQARGLPVISRYAELVAYWIVEVGALNQVIHVWAYHDAADRATRRAGLYADPAWVDGYLPDALDDVVSQESRLLTAAPFSPIR